MGYGRTTREQRRQLGHHYVVPRGLEESASHVAELTNFEAVQVIAALVRMIEAEGYDVVLTGSEVERADPMKLVVERDHRADRVTMRYEG